MKKGFTLTELLVSMAIITILSVMGVETYVTTQNSAKLKSDVIEVTSAIRQAQNRALSPSKGDLDGIGPNDKLCAMGVKFDSQKKLQPYYVVENSTTGTCNSSNAQNYGTAIILSSANFGNTTGTFEFGLPFADNRVGEQTIQLDLPGSDIAAKTITVTASGLIKVE